MKTHISTLCFAGDNKYEIGHKLTSIDIDWNVGFSRELLASFCTYEEEYLTTTIPNFPYGLIELFQEMEGLHRVITDDENKTIWGVFESILETNSDVARWYILHSLSLDYNFSPNDAHLIDYLGKLSSEYLLSFSIFLYCIKEKISSFDGKFDPSHFNFMIENLIMSAVNDGGKTADLLNTSPAFLNAMCRTDALISVLRSDNLYHRPVLIAARHFSELPGIFIRNLPAIANDDNRATCFFNARTSHLLMEWYVENEDYPAVPPLCPGIGEDWSKHGYFKARDPSFSDLSKDQVMKLYEEYKYNHPNYIIKGSDKENMMKVIKGFHESGYGDLIGSSGLDAYSLVDDNFNISLQHIDDYVGLHQDEIIGSYAYRYFSSTIMPSHYGTLLFAGLNQRLEDTLGNSMSGNIHPGDLKIYAAMKILFMVKDYILTTSLSGVHNASERLEDLLNQPLAHMAKSVCLEWGTPFNDKEFSRPDLFAKLPQSLKTIDNKLFAKIPLTRDELKLSSHAQRRQSLSAGLDI